MNLELMLPFVSWCYIYGIRADLAIIMLYAVTLNLMRLQGISIQSLMRSWELYKFNKLQIKTIYL